MTSDEATPPDPDRPPDPTPPSSDPDDEATASAEFARTLEEFEQGRRSAAQAAGAAAEIAVGMKVKGKVVSVGEEHTLVDFGGRSEAVAETRHFRAEDGSVGVKPGDAVELFVVEAGEQVVLAPSIRADARAALRQMREARTAGVPVTGRVTSVNSGGIEVDLSGTRAFCPLSQIEAGFCADASVYVGRTLEFLVTSVGETKGSVVLSRRALLRRGEEEQARRLLASLKPGDELDGTVARLESFGAFVDLGGVDGMVHVSEIRHERLGPPRPGAAGGREGARPGAAARHGQGRPAAHRAVHQGDGARSVGPGSSSATPPARACSAWWRGSPTSAPSSRSSRASTG